MTPRQQVQFALQMHVRTPTDLWMVWPQLQTEFPGCSIMLVADDAQHFRLPAHRTYGKAHLISGLAGDSLFFLNARIYGAMAADRSPQIPVDYSILFDTSTASLLRTLLAGKAEPVHQDLRMLLRDFRGNRLNWHIRPYLDENHEAILRHERGQEIFETVLATEKLSALNGPGFLASGRMSFSLSEAELHAAASRHISDYARLLSNGWADELEHRWLFVHTLLLKLALLELREPGRASAKRKFGEFVQFMAEEVGAISLFHVALAAERFKGGRRAALLDHFTGGAKGLVSRARSVSWDILHRQHLYQEAACVSARAEFLVPYFLTFDQALAAAFELYPIKACLVAPNLGFPQTFHADAVENLMKSLIEDLELLARYFNPGASARRIARLHKDAPRLRSVADVLEGELAKYEGG